MKKLYFLCLLFLATHAYSQNASSVVKMEVPVVAMGDNQNYQALSFEPLADNKFSILYFQELAASIAGDREFINDKLAGAFQDAEGKKYIPYSERVIILVRQTFDKTATAPTTDYWIIALRELQSDQRYSLHFPANFKHPIIANNTTVNYNLKHLEQIKGLTTREFEALVLFGKQKYGFYQYPTPTGTVKAATLKEELEHMRSGLKAIGATFGKGDIPKNEKTLFKRELAEGIRVIGTKIDKKDSVEVKLYLSAKDDTNYELLKKQTFAGSITPNFSSTLVYDRSMKVAGVLGYMVLKFKNAAGENKSNVFLMGLNENSEGQFWRLDVSKNTLSSYTPEFAYTGPEGIYVVGYNNEKVFKPYYQHSLLKNDGSYTMFYPSTPAEINSEKSQFLYTDQPKNQGGYSSGSYSSESKQQIPIAILEQGKTKFILTLTKIINNTGSTTITSYGNLSVMTIDGSNKIRERYEIQENKSQDIIFPRLLGQYTDKSYYAINYPNKFKLVLSEGKVETEPLETGVYRLVYMPTEDYLSTNQFGNMLLTKTAVGNKYQLEFYPAK